MVARLTDAFSTHIFASTSDWFISFITFVLIGQIALVLREGVIAKAL